MNHSGVACGSSYSFPQQDSFLFCAPLHLYLTEIGGPWRNTEIRILEPKCSVALVFCFNSNFLETTPLLSFPPLSSPPLPSLPFSSLLFLFSLLAVLGMGFLDGTLGFVHDKKVTIITVPLAHQEVLTFQSVLVPTRI